MKTSGERPVLFQLRFLTILKPTEGSRPVDYLGGPV
jgi:hypothetical protein